MNTSKISWVDIEVIRSVGGWVVKLFEPSDGLDAVLSKNVRVYRLQLCDVWILQIISDVLCS